MYTYKLRENNLDPQTWAVLIYKLIDEHNPNQGSELYGAVTFQGTLANEWAAEYLSLKTGG